MTIPRCVQDALNNRQIAHHIAETDIAAKMAELRKRNSGAQLAIMVILQTTDGNTLQAILSANSLLNLDALNDETGQHVEAVSTEVLQTLLNNKGLETLPAIPEITGHATYVDSQLLDAETIYMESGRKGTLITLTHSGFESLTEHCHSLQIGISLFDLPPLSQDRRHDSADIYTAIRNYTSLQIKKRLADTLEIPPCQPPLKKSSK